jgi:glycosyltransferase involved in cell wall biosynthesis
MQDYEPMFYVGGAVYLLIEQTYRFGFSCIANTSGVANRFKEYSNDVVSFLPGVDRSQFYPGDIPPTNRNKFRLVFYGRPGNPRNSFHLGIEVLCDVKRLLGERAQIISVGAEWSPAEYDLDGIVENWGLLKTIEEVAQCYRDSDMGLVFMATPHPSYQPLEYMASGCVVATNLNEGTRWILNKDNSLLLEPNPGVAAERIVETLQDSDKMTKLRHNGLQTVRELDWEAAYQVFEDRLNSTA